MRSAIIGEARRDASVQHRDLDELNRLLAVATAQSAQCVPNSEYSGKVARHRGDTFQHRAAQSPCLSHFKRLLRETVATNGKRGIGTFQIITGVGLVANPRR